MPKTNTSSTNFKRLWLWLSDEGNWERFSAKDNAAIEKALKDGNHGLMLERNHTAYFLDLSRRTQTNGCTGRMRPIRPVTRGAHWLVEDANDSTVLTPYFSEPELEEMEKTLFYSKQECYILQRGDQTHYVDLLRWTVTDLSTDCTRNIHVSSSQDLPPCKEQSSLDGSDCTESCTSSESSSSSDGTDGTAASYHQQVPTDKKSSSGTWRWERDSDSWSAFDDDIAAAIEATWESGASEMMFERGSDVYFVDLKNLTQINIETGFTRAIERVEPDKS